jgi:transcriptional repressor NrdR
MHCPYCQHTETEVVETRYNEDLDSTRRRRECKKCGKRFTTYERIERAPIIVSKKDGRKEQFEREKLRGGIIKAIEKTQVGADKVEEIVDGIERELRNRDSIEIDSREIGKMVAGRLKTLDKVAYIRFASVFKRFVDVEEFERELKKLL